MECVKNMIFVRGIPFELWVEVVNMVMYIKDQCPPTIQNFSI